MSIFGRIVSGVARRFGDWPLQLIGSRSRAEVLENLTERMITVAPIPGGSIRFYTPSTLLLSRAESVLTKEADMIRWIDGFPEGAVFWDIGANIGVFSLYAGLRRGVTVLSFEPSAANFHVLSRNIQINDLSERLTAYCVAFSGTTELGLLNLASPAMGSALSQFGQKGEISRYHEGANGSVHGMIGFSIDDFIRQFRPPFPNYLKIDVDGLEWPILQGAQRTLADARLRNAMIELSISNNEEREEAIDFLAQCGLRLKSW
jgi:FkbM family methyltransferase